MLQIEINTPARQAVAKVFKKGIIFLCFHFLFGLILPFW